MYQVLCEKVWANLKRRDAKNMVSVAWNRHSRTLSERNKRNIPPKLIFCTFNPLYFSFIWLPSNFCRISYWMLKMMHGQKSNFKMFSSYIFGFRKSIAIRKCYVLFEILHFAFCPLTRDATTSKNWQVRVGSTYSPNKFKNLDTKHMCTIGPLNTKE